MLTRTRSALSPTCVIGESFKFFQKSFLMSGALLRWENEVTEKGFSVMNGKGGFGLS